MWEVEMARKRKPVYLDEITEQTLRLQKRTLDRLESWSERLDDSPEAFDATFAKELANVTKALATVLKEARAINKENREATSKLGPSEKRRLLLDYFQKLAYEAQRSLVWEMTQLLNNQRMSVKE
tara:strand:+ start:295 stop:669 length:375 start_codon:yes stop_codon:yes gene_type:complete